MGTEAGQASLKAQLNFQRKAAITGGGAFDHAGNVSVKRMARAN